MLVTGITRESIRFRFSPLLEVVRALKVFVDPRPHAQQMTWLRRARRRATPLVKKSAIRFKRLLLPAPELFANLLPADDSASFADELSLLVRSKAAFRETMIRRFIGKPLLTHAQITPSARAAALARLTAETSARDVDEVRRSFCDLLEVFFERCLAHEWEQFETVARQDAEVRAALLRRFGITRMLRTLTRQLTASGDATTAALEFGGDESKGKRLDLAPTATLALTPSYFIWPHATFVILRTKTVDFRIAYPLAIPGTTAGADRRKDSAKVFAALSDATRLHILDLLEHRRLSTRELAGILRISEGGASRHLSILRAAALVTARRDSYFVLYRRTPLAAALLARAATDDDPH